MTTLDQLLREVNNPYRQPASGRWDMRGSVTAELAVVLPAVTALLAILLLSVSAGMLQLRLEEGARAGARALARGDSSAQVMDLVARVAGQEASVSLANSGGYAIVSVSDRVGGVLSAFVPWTQTARATARLESGAVGPGVQVFEGLSLIEKVDSEFTEVKSTLWRWEKPDMSATGRKLSNDDMAFRR